MSEARTKLIGVHLIANNDPESGICLGVIKTHSHDIPLGHLKNILQSQICTLPENYLFCTKKGWHINKAIEGDVLLNQIIAREDSIYIQRQFDKPCVGVKQQSGEKLGIIFVDFKSSLADVRHCIQNQLQGSKLSRYKYTFLTHNGWPISNKQEDHLTVIDIMEDSCLIVEVEAFLTPTGSPSTPSPQPRKKIKGTRHLSFRSSKDLDRKQIADSSVTDEKQILISYVRTDAAHHALALKQELSALGFSVYLDVHEITSGVDWQDSLNDAVRHCQVFVPLVTPKYGETLWTNREVKLADVLGKYIVPVNFLSDWPPPCLAIQFSTTQYISWTLSAQTGEKRDIYTWDSKDLRHVAYKIAEKVQKFINTESDVPSLMKRKTVVRSCPIVDVSNSQACTENREGRQLVVVCVHPKQTNLAMAIKSLLEENNLEVWCSTQLCIEYPDSLQDQVNGIKPGSLEIRNRQIFQDQADEAGVIIFILSQEFISSRTCQQQVFYCEQRKKCLPLLCGDLVLPGWLDVLTGGQITMTLENYQERLMSLIESSLQSLHCNQTESQSVQTLVADLKTKLMDRLTVHIVGSQAVDVDYMEKVCRSIGEQLATLCDTVIGTCGVSNVENFVAESFHHESVRFWKVNNQVLFFQTQSQDRVKSFGKSYQLPKELFHAVVSQTFDVLILVGDETRHSRIIENFMWNEKLVIPVLCEESKYIKNPIEINKEKWSILKSKESTPDLIGKTVKDILLNYILTKESSTSDSVNRKQSPNSSLRKMTTVLLP